MKHAKTIPALKTLLMTGAMAICTAWPALAGEVFGNEESFDAASAVSDEELAGMRGGFLTAGGLFIDFAINTRTLVDGVLQNELAINTQNIQNTSSGDLHQLITVSQDGINKQALNDIINNTSLLNVLQNSRNNTVIQTISTLDITASNLGALENGRLTNGLDFQNINALH